MKNPEERWEEGIEHHPLSEKLFQHIMDLDLNHNNDYFCWKKGGDGDNGETLMYLLDMFFESESGKAFMGKQEVIVKCKE